MKNLLTIMMVCACTSLAAQNTDSAAVYFQKGMAEKNEKRFLAASLNFQKAVAFDKNFKDAYLQNGYANLEMRKTDAAMQDFKAVLQLEPSNEEAVKELADLYFSYRQYQNAIDLAQKCSSCQNKDKIIAISYFQMEDYGRAEKALVSLVAKNPKDAEITYTLAKTYLEMELESKAIPFYEKALQLDPAKSKWAFELGLLFFNSNNFKKAAAYFNQAADNGYPRSNDFNENLGFAYMYSGEYDKGEKIITELVARKPGDKTLLRDMAEAFYQAKQYDRSLDYCQKLMEMDIKDGKALYQAGLCFQKKGQVERGQQMCDKAIELDPSLSKLRTKQEGMF